jgi:hypothetical protein
MRGKQFLIPGVLLGVCFSLRLAAAESQTATGNVPENRPAKWTLGRATCRPGP